MCLRSICGRKRGVIRRAGGREAVNKAAASRIAPLLLPSGLRDVQLPTPSPLAVVVLSARPATLPKIARSMLSRLWKLSGNVNVRGSGNVRVTGRGCDDVVAVTVVSAD